MESENCEGHDDRALFMLASKIALFAAVFGIGACARHRRRHHLQDASRSRDGHGDGAHARHCECAGREDRHGDRGRGPAKSKIDPLRILEKRFASGEIDEDEFRRRWSVLQEIVPEHH